jgi:prevent-host-death family protein
MTMTQIQLSEAKNRLSACVKAVQAGARFEITVRGVPAAQLIALPKTSSKTGYALRVLTHMSRADTPVFDVQAALQVGRQ